METTEEISTGFLNKKSTDMTVSDTLMVALVGTVIVTVTPIVVKGVVAGGQSLYRKFKKTDRKLEEVPKIADKK